MRKWQRTDLLEDLGDIWVMDVVQGEDEVRLIQGYIVQRARESAGGR